MFGYACIMCICRKTAIWLFLGHSLAFFDENRLATLLLLDELLSTRNKALNSIKISVG